MAGASFEVVAVEEVEVVSAWDEPAWEEPEEYVMEEGWEPADDDGAGEALAAPSEAEPDQAVSAGEGAPRHVIRGAKLHLVGLRRGIKLDWVRLVGPRARLDAVRALLVAWFGEPERRRGLWFYAWSEAWECKARLVWGSAREERGEGIGPDDTFAVELPGGLLTLLGDEAIERVRDLVAFGLKASRVDIAGDFHLEAGEVGTVGLVDTVREACQAGELCLARRHEPRRPMSGRRLIGNSVYIGRRGKLGSGRMVRVYDKGLEQEEGAEPGRWERWEVEFSGECAEKVLQGVCDLPEWWQLGWSFLLGAVDFRRCTGERSLERRSRCDWWSDLVECTLEDYPPTTIKECREPPELRQHIRHLRKNVLPTALAMAARVGWSLPEFWSWVLQESGPIPRHLLEKQRPVVWEFVQVLKRRGQTASDRLGTPF